MRPEGISRTSMALLESDGRRKEIKKRFEIRVEVRFGCCIWEDWIDKLE
jgi:hypothetical protein